MEQKIELMLKVYRERLEKANTPPIDHVLGVQTEAQITVLETLLIYASQERESRSGSVCTCEDRYIGEGHICENCGGVA